MTLTVRPRTIFKTKRHNMGLMSEHVEHGFGPVWDGESRKSAQLYRKLIEPRLTEAGIAIGMTQLPSTSPANASMRLPDLITAYREAFREYNIVVRQTTNI